MTSFSSPIYGRHEVGEMPMKLFQTFYKAILAKRRCII